MRATLPAYLSILVAVLAPQFASADTLTNLGTPGLVDMPSADVPEDGEIALTTSIFGNINRNTLAFQVFPQVYGVFRYSLNRGFFPTNPNEPDLFDRSFDLHYQIVEETGISPSLAIGLRDFGGTGILSSEYLVATKHFGDRWELTGGLGWGRLAQRDGFSNPLSFLGEDFETRPNPGAGGISETGQLDFGSWFKGDAALFGGVAYQATEKLSFQIGYSTDAYDEEVGRGMIEIESPLNAVLTYSFENGSSLGA
ncbi:MAG: YjbH domain-containing protein [Yoonia sp.]|uniref:YjbH domain-containing protein n=1 Tax=Yoonia sp. TaxID=2212373 RepID=UPI003EF29AF4